MDLSRLSNHTQAMVLSSTEKGGTVAREDISALVELSLAAAIIVSLSRLIDSARSFASFSKPLMILFASLSALTLSVKEPDNDTNSFL